MSRSGALPAGRYPTTDLWRGESMSAYAIVNLKEEVEDSLSGRATGIEGRFARKHLESEHLGVSYLRYSPGVRSSSAHSHREQEEAYVVISGSGKVRLDDEIRELRCWDVVRVNPATVRAFEAGDDGLELIPVGSDRPDGGDGVFVDTAWIADA
ncbi:MAG TPA: cupin domain-containing protein [Gaiellaceae bacterium]|nr:cupin domain-containing protein [Gaiellaceae bacterium]